MPGRLKVASFTVHATAQQSARWKQVAEAEGFASVGSWAALALDAYLKARARAGLPVPLAWRKGRFHAELEGEAVTMLPGFVSPPFGAFRGTAVGHGYQACHRFTLVYMPSGRILATVRTFAQCKALASELARAWVRLGGTSLPKIPRHFFSGSSGKTFKRQGPILQGIGPSRGWNLASLREAINGVQIELYFQSPHYPIIKKFRMAKDIAAK